MKSTDPAALTDANIQFSIDSTEPDEIIAHCRRVSVKKLQSPTEPKLHEHHKLSLNDKAIWDQSYLKEYLGLHEGTQTWEYITEAEYRELRPLTGNALPSMAISKIKTDADGNSDRAKYRIVVLSNLDPHNWSSSDCFAPVLSLLELRLMISLTTKLRIVPKTGDVSQAFCQSVLPENKKYIIKPPKGCPITPSDVYLLLKNTLYGLKRSQFSSKADYELESFVKIPIDPSQLRPLTDANWGPQDQSVPNPNNPPILLDLLKSYSIAGYIIWLGGPLDWCS